MHKPNLSPLLLVFFLVTNLSPSYYTLTYDAALRTLWLNLDQYKNDNRIFFVCATNNYKGLHPTLVDRFGTNVIELKNPDKDKRKAVIEQYFDKLDPLLLDKVARK